MTIIKISSANLLPFGLLSNHYPFEFSIDDIDYKKQITYNNVSQYIYENMIPYFIVIGWLQVSYIFLIEIIFEK